jgi:integrase
VPQAHIDSVLPLVSAQVRAMIQVQLLTACRPGEVCMMRACDIDMTGRAWIYHPTNHKTAYHGHQREIYVGPKAQEVIKPFNLDTQAFLFNPAEAERARSIVRRAKRKTRLTPSQWRRKPKKNPKRAPRDCYSVNTYRRAIQRACDKASVPPWHPHQLRHNAGTALRKEFGVELARIILGHSTAFTTEIYAEVDRQQAMEVIAKIG